MAACAASAQGIHSSSTSLLLGLKLILRGLVRTQLRNLALVLTITSLITFEKLACAITDKQARNTFHTTIYICKFRWSLRAGSYYKHAGWCVRPHVSQYESTRMMKIGTRACIILKHNSVRDHTEEPYYIYVLALARPYGCNTSHMLHTCPGH